MCFPLGARGSVSRVAVFFFCGVGPAAWLDRHPLHGLLNDVEIGDTFQKEARRDLLKVSRFLDDEAQCRLLTLVNVATLPVDRFFVCFATKKEERKEDSLQSTAPQEHMPLLFYIVLSGQRHPVTVTMAALTETLAPDGKMTSLLLLWLHHYCYRNGLPLAHIDAQKCWQSLALSDIAVILHKMAQLQMRFVDPLENPPFTIHVPAAAARRWGRDSEEFLDACEQAASIPECCDDAAGRKARQLAPTAHDRGKGPLFDATYHSGFAANA